MMDLLTHFFILLSSEQNVKQANNQISFIVLMNLWLKV